MARPRKMAREDDGESGGENPTKDFAGAVRLYRGDIKPARSSAAEHMQEASTAFKAVKKQCHIQPGAVKAAISNVVEAEEAKAEDWLRGFVGFVNEAMGRTILTFHGNDLVDLAEGKTEAAPRRKPQLVPVGDIPADDSDLAGD